MMTVRVVALIFLCVLAAAALLFTFPSLKEGYDAEELPIFAGMITALSALGYGWWRLCGRAHSTLFRIGLAVIAVPFAAYAYLSGKVLFNLILGTQMAHSLTISNYREQPITWPGFDGPIGLSVEFDAQHKITRSGNLYSPVIAFEPGLSYKTYFRDYTRAQLMSPLFQRNPLPSLSVSPTHLRYDLYPSNVKRIPDGRICIAEQRFTADVSLETPPGALAAGWFLAAHGGAIADFSSQLTEAVRRGSTLPANPAEWQRIFKRVRPEGLAAAGYSVCAGQQPGSYDVCYCR